MNNKAQRIPALLLFAAANILMADYEEAVALINSILKRA